jgi:membrane protease subunit (stomatin/prohibitin family)
MSCYETERDRQIIEALQGIEKQLGQLNETLMPDIAVAKEASASWKLGKSGCMYFCSSCNYAAHPREVDEWNFCPRCGEKMKG